MPGRRHAGRAPFPEQTPPPLNHAVLTGKLLRDPRDGSAPCGDPVTLLEVEFPVAHPEYPRFQWAQASYDIELPGEVGARHADELRAGAQVLVAGQLSERLEIVDGRTGRSPTIVAALIHPGPPPERGGAGSES